MYSVTDKIIQNAKKVVRECATRDAARIARELEITVLPRDFKRQKGVYKIIERNPFIFIKSDLHPVLHNIVLLHEIGHDRNHKEEAIRAGGFNEYNIFDLQASRLEYEANLFASEVSLPDDISSGVDAVKAKDFPHTPQSKAIWYLLRLGLEAEKRKNARAAQNTG